MERQAVRTKLSIIKWEGNMEIIGSVLFLTLIWGFYRMLDIRARNYSITHKIDWKRVSDDRTFNNLHESDINRNMLKGKYDAKRK